MAGECRLSWCGAGNKLQFCKNSTFTGPRIVGILQYISNKMQRYTVYLYLETAVHVSGGISTHRLEHTRLYLQYLVLVNRYCYLSRLQPHQNRSIQFPHHTQTSSSSSTIAKGSSNGLTSTRYCRHSCVCS